MTQALAVHLTIVDPASADWAPHEAGIARSTSSWQLHHLLQLATFSRKNLDHSLPAAIHLVIPLTQAQAVHLIIVDPASADWAPHEADQGSGRGEE